MKSNGQKRTGKTNGRKNGTMNLFLDRNWYFQATRMYQCSCKAFVFPLLFDAELRWSLLWAHLRKVHIFSRHPSASSYYCSNQPIKLTLYAIRWCWINLWLVISSVHQKLTTNIHQEDITLLQYFLISYFFPLISFHSIKWN